MCDHMLNQRCFPNLGPKTAQRDAAAETAETGLAPRVAALNVATAATRPETAEVPHAVDPAALTPADAATLTIVVIVALHATTAEAEATAEATPLKIAEVVVAGMPTMTVEVGALEEAGAVLPSDATDRAQTISVVERTAHHPQSTVGALLAHPAHTEAQRAHAVRSEDQGREMAQCEAVNKEALGATA